MADIYQLAGIKVQIDAFDPTVLAFCSDYAVNGKADFVVRTDQADIDYERAHADHSGYSDTYLETLAIYRKIAEKMPDSDTFLFHGSAIALDGQAYVFTAKSGTGKSTHTRLWQELFGDRTVMVNDDKPLIKVHSDGTATAYGTPWDGKHHLSNNIAVPVRAICILERAKKNHIREITKAEALPMLIQQTYRPAVPAALAKTLQLIDRLDVKLYRLSCNMDISAAKLSYENMKG